MAQQIASESSQCAGLGGAFYVSPSLRGRFTLPAGSTPLFDGCYTVPNSSCVDSVLPAHAEQVVNCGDDVTGLLKAVAPTGHGPVISSLDDVVDDSAPAGAVGKDPVKPLVDTYTWCTHDTACTVVLEAAEEAAVEVVLAPVAEAAVDWLLVLGAGIALKDNFDTYTNWGGEKGKWIDGLKMYAEIVKTTTQVSAKYTIPFTWDALKDVQLRELIDSA